MLTFVEQDFLWKIIHAYFFLKDSMLANKLTSSLYEGDYDFPSEIESLLLDFWNGGEEAPLLTIAKYSVEKYIFDVSQHVMLISILVGREIISIEDALNFLNVTVKDENNLLPVVSNVLDVAWLLKQDKEFSGLESSDNDLLRSALFSVESELAEKF